ncbi:EscU/YscU/HrcU family type III secretion system export apparatus switch protein [Metabacillus sp. RGM 3146]|uniref:EscU/YscU/HrcU family type III secretion system export apparatus switch protein n=1 Tax=Metabacillus sp. RGM 3146 TaxID=3401092 RepID=UPI003B9D3DBF
MNIKKAVALRYNTEKDNAPVILAKGSGSAAEKIIEKAAENHIPVQEDPNLVQLLQKLDIQQEIPEELYGAVAEIFAFLYKMDRMSEELQEKG